MKALTKSVVFSRREKLLLGLLSSTLIFSASFSYGAVNQAKVDSIMQTITSAANNFSSQADRDTYYQRVYTGLSDAIDMLAVVRNNVGAMIGAAPVTVPPLPPTGGANPLPVTITNPIADYPIPPPCPAGVKIQKELVTGNAQPRMTVFDRTAYPSGIVYKLPANKSGEGFKISINGNSYGIGHTVAYGKISPYPCDFPAGVGSSETSGCFVSGGSKLFDVSSKEFSWKDYKCNLKEGQTYYVNIKAFPQRTDGKTAVEGVDTETVCNRSDMPCGVLTSFMSSFGAGEKFWGIYDTFEDHAANRTKQNSTSENPETLRQKVINDYKTKGMNTDGATGAPSGGAPAPVTNPIANYPIPAPCSAGTVLNKELLGTINGAWIERAFPKASDIVPGHVYKLRIDEPDGQGNGSIGWGDAPPERISTTVKISPYPCDFVTLEQEKKYYDGRITVAARLKTWWDSVTVPASTTIGACMALGISGNHQYKIGSAFANPSISSLQDCTLVKGVTYYVNIRPSFTHMHGNGCNGTYACNYHLVDGGSQKMPSARLQLWGIYNTYEEFLTYKLKANVSSENVESLRQKVVSDYATKGVNTDGLTNTALGGTAVTPPVGTGGGPVIVREGPWERVEDIFCPATLTGATDGLQILYPNGYNYSNQGNTYWNVKDYQKPTDISLPATCTTGKKFVKHGMQGTCYVYECKN